MMRKFPTLAGLLLALALGGLAGCDSSQQAPATAVEAPAGIDWKMASAFKGSLPILGTGGRYFAERLDAISGGRIKFAFQEPGEQVPAFEIFDAVGRGDVQAGWSSAGSWIAKVPAAPFFSAVPFGPNAIEYLAWLYHGGGLALWREIYAPHNIHPIPCGMVPPEASGWFRTAVTSPAKLKGLKIRFYGIGGLALQKLGAGISLLSEGEEIAKALERGVLDGAEYALPSTDDQLGLAKAAKHYYFPGWHQQAALIELIVNLNAWKGLAAADQALIETACRDAILQTSTEGEALQGAALAALKKQGVQLHLWSVEFLNAFKKAHDEVMRELSAKDRDFAKVHQSYRKFRENYREWFRLSRLPEKFR